MTPTEPTTPAETPNESRTPRVDAYACNHKQAQDNVRHSQTEWMSLVPADFARELETSLARANAENTALRAGLKAEVEEAHLQATELSDLLSKANAENAELKAKNRAMQNAIREVVSKSFFGASTGYQHLPTDTYDALIQSAS